MKKLLLEALLSLGGKGDLESVYEYMKERAPSLTKGELENLIKDMVYEEGKVVQRGNELLLND